MALASITIKIDPKTGESFISPGQEMPKINLDEIPKHEMDALCRVILRSATKAFEDPEYVAAYEQWLAERQNLKTTISADGNG